MVSNLLSVGNLAMTPGFHDTILKHFSSLEDPRIERTKQHLLEDIVAIAILAVIGGADSWVAIETYAQVKQDWLASATRIATRTVLTRVALGNSTLKTYSPVLLLFRFLLTKFLTY